MELVEALAGRTSVTITLPGGDAVLKRLASAGFTVRHFTELQRAPRRVTFSAATPEREAEEIARRILMRVEAGRRFRDIGIVLRAYDPYGPLLETTLARFGIPARFYFTARVDESEAGNLVQGGLYLMAAERALKLDPVGMLYCGRRRSFWDSWHVSGSRLKSA